MVHGAARRRERGRHVSEPGVTILLKVGRGTEPYQVYRSHDCFVVKGAIPVDDMAALSRVWRKRGATQVDAALSQALGFTLVCGSTKACDAWRKELGIGGESA